MTEKLYRCTECQDDTGTPIEFESKTGDCPKCGASEAMGLVVPLVRIHFDPPSKFARRGLGTLACNPEHKVGVKGHRATGDPSVVNCPDCRNSDAWKKADDVQQSDPARDRVARVAAVQNKLAKEAVQLPAKGGK